MMFFAVCNNNKRIRWLVVDVQLVVVAFWVLLVSVSTVQAEGNSGSRIELPKALEDHDFHPTSPTVSKVGQLLFYDKVLSGNQNISCSTCHHQDHASADGVSLPVGEGGVGLGPDRTVGVGPDMIEQRVPRNSPALFNLGAKQFTTLFHDGRVSIDPLDPSGFDTPAEEDLPLGLETLAAAQAMFPVTSPVEMAGEFGENEIANAANRDFEYVWPLLEKRIRNIPQYVRLFQDAFADISSAEDITMVHIANALAEFQMSEWRADKSRFDDYLRGESNALTGTELEGLNLFYGRAGCSDCHSGVLQTDHKFHAIAIPQIGYPLTRKFDPVVRDTGRLNETNRYQDRYRFRTPSLRNVSKTAPYGHSGAYKTLEAIVRHHLDPVRSFNTYDRTQVVLAKHPVLDKKDFIAMDNRRETKVLLSANELQPRELADEEVAALIDFLNTLTDSDSLKGRLGVPESVPSGLKID